MSDNSSNAGCSIPTLIGSVLTSMIGYHWHHSIFWAILDFIFWPIAWVKWLICHDVNMQIIRETFSWFFAS